MKKFPFKTLTKPVILLVCFAVLALLRPNSFPTVSNLSNVLWSISVYGIMTSGTIFFDHLCQLHRLPGPFHGADQQQNFKLHGTAPFRGYLHL